MNKTDGLIKNTAHHNFFANAIEAMALIQVSEDIKDLPENFVLKQTLFKSCVVLMVACWEAYVEEMVKNALDIILANTNSPEDLPNVLRTKIANELKKENHDLAIWKLAGEGWKDALKQNVEKQITAFHNPKATNIDDLFCSCIGLKNISSKWNTKNLTYEAICSALKTLIELRGDIAHKVKAPLILDKKLVNEYGWLLILLSSMTSEYIRVHILECVKVNPWTEEEKNHIELLANRYING